MTTFISGLMTVIMLICGAGNGAVTLKDVAVNIGGENFALDPAITAAYSVDEDRAAAEISMDIDGEQLFKTDLELDNSGVRLTARDDVSVTVTSELVDSLLEASGVDKAEIIGSMERMCGMVKPEEKKAQLVEMSNQIMQEWVAGFDVEPVDGTDGEMQHITGTVDNDMLMGTVDMAYRALIGDQAYDAFVGLFSTNYAEEGIEIKELSDIYKMLGMEMSIDLEGTVNDELYGIWDMVMNFKVPHTEEEDTVTVPMSVAMQIRSVDADHSTMDMSMLPTKEMPIDLVCTARMDGNDMVMDYNFSVANENGADMANVVMNMIMTEAEQKFAMNVKAEDDSFTLDYTHIGDEGKFAAEYVSGDTVMGGLSFTLAFSDAEISTSANNAAVISSMEDANGIDIASIATGYMNDAAKLMGNESVNALIGRIAEMTAQGVEEVETEPAA